MGNESNPGGTVSRVEEAIGLLESLAAGARNLDGVRALLAEMAVDNRRLLSDNIRLAKALVAAKDDSKGTLLETLQAAQQNLRIKQSQVADIMDENTELHSRILTLEELNGSMMSMYVSSFQLHASLDVGEVVRVIEEILVNFLGAGSYAVLLRDHDDALCVVGERNLDGRLAAENVEPRGVLAEVIGSQTAYVHTSNRAAREGILAAVPFVIGSRCVGATLIYSLLSQKDRLLNNDIELLSLLGGHAASALLSAQLYERADRKLKTLEGMLDLLSGD